MKQFLLICDNISSDRRDAGASLLTRTVGYSHDETRLRAIAAHLNTVGKQIDAVSMAVWKNWSQKLNDIREADGGTLTITTAMRDELRRDTELAIEGMKSTITRTDTTCQYFDHLKYSVRAREESGPELDLEVMQ